MAILTCARDGRTDLQIFQLGMISDPPGWSFVSVHGAPIRNARLCPSCTSQLRGFLEGVLAVAVLEAPTKADGCACGHTCDHGPHEVELDHATEASA